MDKRRFEVIPDETIWSEAKAWLFGCVWRAKALHREMGYRKLYAIIPGTHAKNAAREVDMDADEKAYQEAMKQVAMGIDGQFTTSTEYVERLRSLYTIKADKAEAQVHEVKQVAIGIYKIFHPTKIEMVEKDEEVEKVKSARVVKRSHTRYMLRRVRCGMSKKHLLHKVNKRNAKL
jgi:hypothetical protein